MVKDTGKTTVTDAIKPVNAPEQVRVKESAAGVPLWVTARRIIAIEDRWRIDDEWWRDEPVSRMYFKGVIASGQYMVIYKDLVGGRWYRQGY